MDHAPTLYAGKIGGFYIGPERLTDALDTMGMSSELTDTDDVRFYAGSSYENRAIAPFRVTRGGVISATSGTVGGWTLGANTLTGGNATLASSGALNLGTGDDVAVLSAADATYRLWIGDATPADAPFSVTKAGALVASDATITGTIKTGSTIESGVTVPPAQYALTLSASGAPNYNVTGAGNYDAGDVVAITAAQPPVGAATNFLAWTGGWPDIDYVEDVNDNTTFVVMNKDITLSADYI